MKIETHLSPNCSESAFVVVDWKSKRIITSYDFASDGIEEGEIRDFISEIQGYIADGYSVEQLNTKSGDSFHPALVATLQEFKEKGLIIDTKNKKRMEALGKELLELEKIDNTYETMLKHTSSKVELLAKGYYGRKEK